MLRARRTLQGRRGPDVVACAVVSVVVLLVLAADPSRGGLLLIAGPVLVAGALVAVQRPVVATLVVLAVSFLREPLKSVVPGDSLLNAFYLMVVAVVIALFSGALKPPRLGLVDVVMGLYVMWNLASAVLPHDYPATDVWRFIVKGTLVPLGLYVVGRFVFTSERSIRWLMWMVAGFTAYSSFNAIADAHGAEALVWPRYVVASNWEGRAVGVFNHPVVNGLLLALGFVVLLYLAQDDRLGRRAKAALYVVAGATAYAVNLTHTRSALLALVVLLVVGALWARGWRTPFVVAIVLGCAAIAANWSSFVSSDRESGGVGSSNEIVDRLNIAATAFRAIVEHPVMGVGIGRFASYNTDSHVQWSPDLNWERGYGIVAHENELGIGAELGLVGLALWLSVLVLVVVSLFQARKDLPVQGATGQRLAFVGLAAMVVWLATGTTVDMRFLDFANALPWLLAGVAVGVHERVLVHGRPTFEPSDAEDHPAARKPGTARAARTARRVPRSGVPRSGVGARA